ncbi:12370_t:CDS:1, partial [Cetraspora pellucida]
GEDNNIASNTDYFYQEWNKGLTNIEVEHKRYLQDFFIKFAIGARIEITWSIVNEYQNVLIINNSLKNRPQLIDLDETHLTDILQ